MMSGNSRTRVLLVDDDEPILESLQIILEDRYEISVAENGARALEVLEQTEIDVIVLDLMMPVLDGIGVMTELGRRGIGIPVVVISAGHEAEQQALSLNATAFLKKPFDVEQLECAIERAASGGSPGGAPPRGGDVSGSRGGNDPERHTRHQALRGAGFRSRRPSTAPASPHSQRVPQS